MSSGSHISPPGGKPILDHAGVHEYLASLTQRWESFHHEPEEFSNLGDKVVAFLHTSNGKVLRFVTYLDRGKGLNAANEHQ